MGDPYYSTSSSKQFLNSNYDEPVDGRRSHQIFSFNPVIGQSTQQRNTVQDRRDIDKIMQRYSNPQNQDKAFFQSSNLASQQFGQYSTQEQNSQNTGAGAGGGPVNFVDSTNFDDLKDQQKHQANQKYQVNYPNLLDDDTSLMTSLNQSRNPNDTQAYSGVVNPFMKNFDNSIRTDADDLSPNNYDKFHQFERLDLNQIAASMKQSNNGERITFGFNNSNLFELRQSQMNNNNNNQAQQQNQQINQINYSLGGGRDSQHSITSQQQQQLQQQQINNSNFKILNSPVSNQCNYSQNFAQSLSGQFGQNQQQVQFEGLPKPEEVVDNDDNMILKDINNDDPDNNIFGSDDDLTKQEEQEQRVNQMHAEISVLNDQVHKMLQTYKNQLDKQSDKKLVKKKVKQDANLLSKNYREIIGKFEDLSNNNDISDISINSKSNMSSFAGYSLLRGNTKKEKEINVMMNLVEQFLCKFDDDFQNQSISRQAQSQQQSISVKPKQVTQDDKYQQLLKNQKQSNIYSDFDKLSIKKSEEQKPPLLAQQYQLNIQNQPKPSIQVQQQQQNQQYQQTQQQYQQQQQQQLPSINLVISPPQEDRKSNQISNSPQLSDQRNSQNPSIQNSPSYQQRVFNPQQDLNAVYAKLPQGIMSNQSSGHSASTVSSQQGVVLEMDKIVQQHKKDHQDNPFNSSIQSPHSINNNSVSQSNTPVSYQQNQIFFNTNNNILPSNLQQLDMEETVKRTQLPPLRQVSSAQPQLTLPPQQIQLPSSTATTPIQNHIYSQSTRTSGVNQFNYNTFSGNPTLTVPNEQISYGSNSTLAPPKTFFLSPNQFSSQPNSLSNIPQFSRSPSLNPTSPIPGSLGSTNLNIPTANYTQATNQNVSQPGTTRDSHIFDIHEQLDLYCTNCDQYYKVGIYFEHVKICDKDHTHKLNQALDDTFYSLEQSTAVMNRLDQKIDKISRNISNALQLQKLPQTRDILSDTIKDLAETLKSENGQTVKKIIKKIEQNTKTLDAQSGNQPQSSSYKLYLYLKRVTNILREKETALEQSAMLREISMIYPTNKTNNTNNANLNNNFYNANLNNNNSNNTNNNLINNIHPITAQLQQQQQQQQQNFYAPRFSYQPNSNTMNFNTNFTRNTVSTNSDLEKKSKFYDLAGEIKNKLPPNHVGSSFLISELYEEAKSLPENQWQTFLQNKFKI